MDPIQFELARLIAGYVQGTLSEADEARLNALAARDPSVRDLMDIYDDDGMIADRLTELAQIPRAADWEQILQKYSRRRAKRYRFNWMGMAAAALIFVLLGWWAIKPAGDPGIIQDKAYGQKNDVLPGGNKALLTLTDGQQLILEGQHKQITDGAAVMDLKGGVLAYRHRNREASQANQQPHQLIVPKGGTYTLVLEDGTKVWINANSTLKFPATFDHHERRVHVNGEAYFEVAKDAARPFIVEAAHLEIEAVGTAFNVNSYRSPGYVKAILTEGKIKVDNGRQQRIMTAGNAVEASAADMKVSAADLEEALAWRDGYFYFDRKAMGEILDEVARWYDVELTIKTNIDDKKYIGGIKRSATLGGVCALLTDLSGLQFEIQGREVTVK